MCQTGNKLLHLLPSGRKNEKRKNDSPLLGWNNWIIADISGGIAEEKLTAAFVSSLGGNISLYN